MTYGTIMWGVVKNTYLPYMHTSSRVLIGFVCDASDWLSKSLLFVCVYKRALKSILTQSLYMPRPKAIFNSTVVAPLVRLYLALILKQTALNASIKMNKFPYRDFPL